MSPDSNPSVRRPESGAGACAQRALPARSWNWAGRRNQGLRKGIPAALSAALGRGGPGQGDPAGGSRGASAPSSIFPVFGSFPLGPHALPPGFSELAPSPGFPGSGTFLPSSTPGPPSGRVLVLPSGWGRGRWWGPEDGAEGDARGPSAAWCPLPPS